jgi:hypothetical protein
MARLPLFTTYYSPSERPAKWKPDLDKYDFEKVGLLLTEVPLQTAALTNEEQRRIFDSSIPGKSVSGHDFTETDRALIISKNPLDAPVIARA